MPVPDSRLFMSLFERDRSNTLAPSSALTVASSSLTDCISSFDDLSSSFEVSSSSRVACRCSSRASSSRSSASTRVSTSALTAATVLATASGICLSVTRKSADSGTGCTSSSTWVKWPLVFTRTADATEVSLVVTA